MTRPLPRWYRHRCQHPEVVTITRLGDRFGRTVCQACGMVLTRRAGA